MPAIEKRLHDYLGAGYHDTDWRPALKAVMDAEGNTEQEQALDAIHKLSDRSAHPRLTIKIPAAIHNTSVEKELAECLHDHYCGFGAICELRRLGRRSKHSWKIFSCRGASSRTKKESVTYVMRYTEL